jgi:serine/threonine-protein kinase
MSMPFQPGAHVEGMRIVRVIGSGSMATVYEVIHEGKRRALKITGSAIDESTFAERVAQEGEALSMVVHLNVVEWYASGLFEGRVWLLLELVDGKNLREILDGAEEKRLGVERAVGLVLQACQGLLALHDKGIIHRDMKPENILVAGDYRKSALAEREIAKIADLSSVKLPGWGVKTTHAHRLTSMRYMAPETWREGAPTTKVDVFAMGQILYECIAGKHPLIPEGASMATICTAQLGAPPPPLASVVADVPLDLSELVQWAVAPDPARRCTMKELVDRLAVVQDRLRAWRRAAARSLPIPRKDAKLALTEPMPVAPDMVAPSMPASGAPALSAGGTIQMSAVPTPTSSAAVTRNEIESGREASPPPAPSMPAPASMAATLRVLSRPAPVVQTAQATEEVRRSTGIPVESGARPSAARPRRRWVGVTLGVGLLAVVVVGAWWTWTSTGGQVAAPKPAVPPPAPTASASVTKLAPTAPPRAPVPPRPRSR